MDDLTKLLLAKLELIGRKAELLLTDLNLNRYAWSEDKVFASVPLSTLIYLRRQVEAISREAANAVITTRDRCHIDNTTDLDMWKMLHPISPTLLNQFNQDGKATDPIEHKYLQNLIKERK